MEWEVEHQRMTSFVDRARKSCQSFSTSTPFEDVGKHCKGRILSASSSEDSGLGISPDTAALGSFVDMTLISGDRSNRFKYQSPRLSMPPPSSPITRKSASISASSLSKKNFTSRHSLDSISDLSFSGGDEKGVNVSYICRKDRFCRGRKLNFDIDIYSDQDYSNISEERQKNEQNNIPPSEIKYPEKDLPHKFEEILATFSPIVPDRLIGRNIGIENMDIMLELDSRNIGSISMVMACLSAKDLCRMCQVSHGWNSVVMKDKTANLRRKKFLKQKRVKYDRGKENFGVKRVVRAGHSAGEQDTNGVLRSRVPAQPVAELSTTHFPEQSKSMTEQFQEAATSLQADERLQKCPRCRRPAKILPVQDRAKCQNNDCNFDYCVKCLSPFHGSKDCPRIHKKQTKNDTIGTKKSKKNLKRL